MRTAITSQNTGSYLYVASPLKLTLFSPRPTHKKNLDLLPVRFSLQLIVKYFRTVIRMLLHDGKIVLCCLSVLYQYDYYCFTFAVALSLILSCLEYF